VLLYRVISTAALAAYSPYALLRSAVGRRRLGSIRGRLARDPLPDLSGGIWVHAVSVGEVGVASSLLALLGRKTPGRRLGLSVTTAAGREVARRAEARGIAVFWFPLDLAGPVERALSSVSPGLVLLTETELWPLFLDRAAAHGIPVALVNGRISERSFSRYRRLGRWFAGVLSGVSRFAMQTPEDAERILRLGAKPDRIRVTGNIKYDLPEAPPFPDAGRLRQAASGRPILVAGSTGEGEEEAVLAAWAPIAGRSLLAIAPRRPERFDSVGELILSRGFALIRRSRPQPEPTHNSQLTTHNSCVYLLDSMGELASLYREASLAFIGGSLVPTGGHNPIEAWAQGICVATGPHVENFRQIAAEGERQGLLERVADAGGLAAAFARAVEDPEGSRARGAQAARAVAENRGAAARTVDYVLPLLESSGGRRASAP
jgi:3-deoxy-D-manno-octulosonic-acid transferase